MSASVPYTVEHLQRLIDVGRACNLPEWRVLLSLVIRADADGDAWPSVELIADEWRMDPRATRRALKSLEQPTADRPAIVKIVVAGGGRSRSARRRLTFADGTAAGRNNGAENPGIRRTQNRVNGARQQGCAKPPEETIEETKEEKPRRTPTRQADQATAAGIYAAYPRKVAKAAAMKGIRKALAELASRGPAAPDGQSWAAWLLGRVNAFADGRRRQIAADPNHGPNFTPYPATWFNDGRYDDDDREWQPRRDCDQANGGALLSLETPSPGLVRTRTF